MAPTPECVFWMFDFPLDLLWYKKKKKKIEQSI